MKLSDEIQESADHDLDTVGYDFDDWAKKARKMENNGKELIEAVTMLIQQYIPKDEHGYYHQHMSAGETAGNLLEEFGVAKCEGGYIQFEGDLT